MAIQTIDSRIMQINCSVRLTSPTGLITPPCDQSMVTESADPTQRRTIKDLPTRCTPSAASVLLPQTRDHTFDTDLKIKSDSHLLNPTLIAQAPAIRRDEYASWSYNDDLPELLLPESASKEDSDIGDDLKSDISTESFYVDLVKIREERDQSQLDYSDDIPGTLDCKEEQAYFILQDYSNHPSVARKQYRIRMGNLWDSAGLILMNHYLYPLDLTESEFVDLVCSQGNATSIWLHKHARKILSRRIQGRLSTREKLRTYGLPTRTFPEAFLDLFDLMDASEQDRFIEDYQRYQLVTSTILEESVEQHDCSDFVEDLPPQNRTESASLDNTHIVNIPSSKYLAELDELLEFKAHRCSFETSATTLASARQSENSEGSQHVRVQKGSSSDTTNETTTPSCSVRFVRVHMEYVKYIESIYKVPLMLRMVAINVADIAEDELSAAESYIQGVQELQKVDQGGAWIDMLRKPRTSKTHRHLSGETGHSNIKDSFARKGTRTLKKTWGRLTAKSPSRRSWYRSSDQAASVLVNEA